MKISVLGQGILADAIAHNCAKWHQVFKAFAMGSDAIWLAHQTPTGPTGEPNSLGIIQTIIKALRPVPKGYLIIVSCQIRLGTTKMLEQMRPDLRFVCVPENVREATAREDFRKQSRIIVGRRTAQDDGTLLTILDRFSDNVILTDPETAEMSKHVMNTFLALNIVFINECARLAAKVGVDANVLSQTLLLDERVSAYAPLKPGSPYAPGHLGREVWNMNKICEENGVVLPVIQNIEGSNRIA